MSDKTNKVSNDASLWEDVVAILKGKISKPSFETWLKPLSLKFMDEETLIINAPNEFTQEWVNERYRKEIIKAVIEVTGREYRVRVASIEETDIFKKISLSGEEAIGYMVLASKEVGLALETIKQLSENMYKQLEFSTNKDAKEQVEWLRSLCENNN